MDKSHKVEEISFNGDIMVLRVDGKIYRVNIARQSRRLAEASPEQRKTFVVSPSGYGIHWPELDEDLSIDGLIGIKHHPPLGATTGKGRRKKAIMAAASQG